MTTLSQSPFLQMAQTTPTSLWCDTADPVLLRQSMQWGAVGATCNPVIALTALTDSREVWTEHVQRYAAAHPQASEDAIGWAMVQQLSREAASMLMPVFREHKGINGRLSIQTDPRFYRDTRALIEQAQEFAQLAENIIVKIPVTTAGLAAFEELTYRGISVNATVSFTVAQTLAVADAVERGLRRREAEGLDTSQMGPVCTIMVGRTDDWMRANANREGVRITPEAFDWAGIAVFKRAYAIYQERGYRTRLLAAAFRNTMHWSELVGGNVVISPPFAWQQTINDSGIDPVNRIDVAVDPTFLHELSSQLPEFRKAYEPEGLSPAEFTQYGASVRTLRQFLQANNELEVFVRDILLADPD